MDDEQPGPPAAVDNPIWSHLLTETDRRVFRTAGYGARAGFGQRPALLVVDVNRGFVGDAPLPIDESVERWRNSCGEAGWTAMEHIATLLDASRAAGVPVMYSTGGRRGRPHDLGPGRWVDKNSRQRSEGGARTSSNDIMEQVAPLPGEVVFEKHKPSAFFGTPLVAHLVDVGVDSLIVCGTTTSGCIRATVVDAFSFNFRVSVVADATFDRGEVSHAINLFDMDQKYADVVSLDETVRHLKAQQ